MVTIGLERRKYLYLIWTLISLVILYFMVQNNLQQYISWIVIALTFKDIFIDTNIFKLRKEKGPWPDKLEHAPFVALVAVGGFLGYLNVSQMIIWIAVADTIIDVADDMGKI